MPDSLPHWSLDDLYQGLDADDLVKDQAYVKSSAEGLATTWKSRLDQASSDELAQVISDYEAIAEKLGRMTSFTDLAFAADMTAPETGRQAQMMRELESDISAQLVFVELELAAMDDARMDAHLATPAMAYWAPWIRQVRAFRPHQLSEEMETMLMERQPSGRSAWVRLFDETAASLKFPIDGDMVGEAEILDMMTDADPELRKKAGLSRSQVLNDNSRMMTLILNTIAKDKSTDDKWRKFSRPVSSRNLANDVEDEVVDALAQTVTARMPDLTHRYYALKAKWMGKDKLPWWDRNAPVPGEDNRKFSWDEAKSLVLDAFGEFDASMAEVASWFFDRNWIDAPQRDGKASGAFSHPTVPSAHPYVLMNYSGNVRDVMTLAHELGHGVHQVLAAPRGHLMCSTPLTLAETASVFGEMLVFRKLMDRTTDPVQRRALLAGKIEDMLNTVVRQIGFHNFETRFHDARKDSELTPDQIAEIWMESQAEALGPSVEIDDTYRPIWGFIPHFIHVPFYVYAYAFGDCLVNALWQVYAKAEDQAAKDGFVDRYLNLLRAGGTDRHDVALAPFGLNAGDAQFWNLGLDMLAGMIDELEAMLDDPATQEGVE
ncbi:MAG: M3 family oligoendopeptidase [Alphaproteobacteria bacterium]|nr:M3 family oligoendopeptidase [Alphaproteobacteria bacterium]